MSRIKTHVKRGDTVEVIAGNHSGATGEVIRVIAEKGQVIVQGVRMVKKHQKPTRANQDGGIIEKEGPIHISNVRKIEAPAPAKKKSRSKAKSAE